MSSENFDKSLFQTKKENLHSLANVGDLTKFKNLFENDLEKNILHLELEDNEGFTPMDIAIKQNHFEIAKYIYSLKTEAKKFPTELHLAALEGCDVAGF